MFIIIIYEPGIIKYIIKIFQAEMVRETSAVNTVFSFVDRARTAEENTLNPTEAALAQLYAHIQSLPESSKKRRLVKQFNKENGHGTPRQFSGGKSSQKSKGFGDSIKVSSVKCLSLCILLSIITDILT